MAATTGRIVTARLWPERASRADRNTVNPTRRLLRPKRSRFIRRTCWRRCISRWGSTRTWRSAITSTNPASWSKGRLSWDSGHNPLTSSEHEFQSDLNLPRVEPGAREHAEGGRSQLIARLTEDRMIGQVEDLDARLEVLRTHREPLGGRRVQADDAGSDQGVARHGAVPERTGCGVPIDEGVGVEKARACLLVRRQLPGDAGV